jgi:hypothetical protein
VPAEFNSGMSSILARAVELERRRQAKEIDRLGETRERMLQRAARQREMQQEKARRAREFLERQERERGERERAALERREAQPPPVIPIHFAPFTAREIAPSAQSSDDSQHSGECRNRSPASPRRNRPLRARS